MLKAFFSYSKHQLSLSLPIPPEEGRALLGVHLFPAEAFLTSLVFSLHHSGINHAMRDVVLDQQFNDTSFAFNYSRNFCFPSLEGL